MGGARSFLHTPTLLLHGGCGRQNAPLGAGPIKTKITP